MMSWCLLFLLALGQAPPQPPAGANPQAPAPQAPAPAGDAKPDAARAAPAEEAPVVTHHEARAGGRTLEYTATTGFLPVRNPTSGDLEARVFFIAYTLEGRADPAKRPLMISVQRRPRLLLGMASPRCARAEARAHER